MQQIIAAFLFLGIFGGVAFTAELKDRMEFPAKNGNVLFYHNNHVNEVKGDCTVCHEKAPGKMAGFGKDVAHKLCIPCHEPREGFPEGPTRCEGCHKK
jgi:predicted CXXCH cytochrome family protein